MKKLLCLLVFWASVATAATDSYRFSRIHTGRESINCILLDSDGFAWFGTSKGLLRYNGIEIMSPWTGNGQSPLGDFISSIQEDAAGRLWVWVNDEKYIVFDRHTKHYQADAVAELRAMTGQQFDNIRLLHIDSERNFWICTDSGAFFMDATTNRVEPIKRDSTQYTTSEVRAAARINEYCYLLYASGMIEQIDTRTRTVRHAYQAPVKRSSTEDPYTCLRADSQGQLWITDHVHGMWQLRPDSQQWRYFGEEAPAGYRLSNNSVRDLLEDADHRIWIATDHGGINIYDPTKGRIDVLMHDPYDQTTLTSNSVYSLYRDTDGNIWVGFYKRGVSLYGRTQQSFFTQHLRPLRNRNLQDDISAICEDREGNIWFGTDEYGVVRRNPTTGEETLFDVQQLGSNVAVCLFCDKRGRVWIGTYQGGLSCYDNGTLRHYDFPANQRNQWANNSIWDVDEDCDGRIWIGSLAGGLVCIDPKSEERTLLSSETGTLSSDCILELACDHGEVIYVSTVDAVEAIDVRTKKRRELIRTGAARMLNICCDSRELLWMIGRWGELLIYNTKTDELITPPAVLASHTLRSVIEDENKNMWLMSDDGLFNMVVGVDPSTEVYTFTTYCYKRYLGGDAQDWSYNHRSVCRTRNGEIIFGSVNGYYTINPNAPLPTSISEKQPHVAFTALRINNTEIKIDSVYDGRVILHQGIEFTDQIDLRHRQNRVSLEFSSLAYTSTFRTEYFYQLAGFADEWSPVTDERNAITFTNLSPGEYTLRLRTLTTTGKLGDDVASLKIVIHPPFWRTSLAYLLYIVLFVGLLWGAIRLFLRRQQHKLERQRAEMETERQNQLNEMKIRFFTNISHDFRTPLSLIITPLEEVRNTCDEELRSSLNIVYRNAQRLLNLVNQLLDFRKLDVYGATLNLSHGDFVAFAREICSSFELFSEDRHITLSLEAQIEHLDMAFDKDKLSKVIMNLLSNAFKYTEGEGQVTLTISTQINDNGEELLSVAVRDTGIGIPDSDKLRIFERFYQAGRDRNYNGSGIGLHIVREFVALHGGSITVTDNQPQGSVFRFVLPVTRVTASAEGLSEESTNTDCTMPTNDRPAILLVEDNSEFRSFMHDSLKREYEIFEAADGVEALELLGRETVQIIISDIMMPRMDGLELCKAVKSNIDTSHIPLILLTARAMQEHELEGLAVGADDYVTKPFNLSILRLRISKLLEWTKNSHELFRKSPEINPSEITITSLDEKLIEGAVKIVEENMDNSEFSVEELSAQLGMHRTHLYKKLTFITGKSPLEFIRIVRLKRAAQLMEKSQMNVSEIAYMVGFNSPKIFAKYFREEFGTSPRDYLREHGAGHAAGEE